MTLSSNGSHGQSAPGVKVGPKPFAPLTRNTVSPNVPWSDCLPGKRPAREADGRVGKRFRSKRRLLVAGEIGIEREQHHPTGNRADFRVVFAHEIDCGISWKGESK
jgi:hypothetical protein